MLRPFLARDCTIGEAARALGVSLERVQYNVRRFETLGVLHVTRRTPRRGRPLKHYRTTSDRYFVPFAITRLESFEALMEIIDHDEQRRFTRALVKTCLRAVPDATRGGALLHRTENGAVSIDFTPHPPPHESTLPELGVGVWSSWTTLHLTPGEAADLERDLTELWRARRTSAVPRPGTRPFTLSLGLTPAE